MGYFDSIYFIFIIALAIPYWALRIKWARKLIIAIGSLAYIGYFDFFAAAIVVGLTIITHWFAKQIIGGRGRRTASALAVGALILSLILIKYFGILEYFARYMRELLDRLPNFSIETLAVPLGISYLTLKYISYLVDIIQGTSREGGVLDLFCYGSFFCIFIAGPIERFERFSLQLNQTPASVGCHQLEMGMSRIL